MEDAGESFQPSKKRAAGVQLSRNNPDLDENETDAGEGTFKRASNEVLATRRIVKIRRQQTSSTPAAPNQGPTVGNPFAAICLVPPASNLAVGSSDTVESMENDNTDGKSETNIDESKDASTISEKINVKHDNAEHSETKSDESRSELYVEISGNEDFCKQHMPVIEKPSGDEISDNEGKNDAKADISVNEAKKDAEADISENVAKKDAEADISEIETKKDAKGKINNDKDGEKITDKESETVSFSSFKPLSSGQNAFSGFAGTGFSSSLFSFGTFPEGGPHQGLTTGSHFGEKNDLPSFSFGVTSNGNSSVFGTLGVNVASNIESSKFASMQEVPVETGEEDEEAVFTADSVLYEFVAGAWKERGKGELKVNVPAAGIRSARLVMRSRGNYRLILNAGLYPDLKLTTMDKKGVTFACVNSAGEGKGGLSTIALKFKDVSSVEEFQVAVMEHKSKTPHALKTPENSP